VSREPGTVFGRIVTADDVERAALQTLKDHAEVYIAEAERQAGREIGAMARPCGFIVATQFEKWPEDQLPVVVLISPGWAGPSRRLGDGSVIARWSLAVGVIHSAAQIERTRSNALIQLGALRTLIAQHQSLGGLAMAVECLDESNEFVPFSDTRSLFGAQSIFTVSVPEAFAYGHGPDGPWGPPIDPPDPTDPPNWGRVKSADVELRAVPVDRELTLADRKD
jgi:hypothetical protein